MDKALKQRLLGATVLVILGVVFIPMILDGPPTDGYQEIEVPIPDQLDRGYETRLLPVNPSTETVPVQGDSSEPQTDLGTVVETRVIPMDPADAEPVQSGSTNQTADAEPAPVEGDAPAVASETTTATAESDAGSTSATTQPQPQASSDMAVQATGWTLQLGTFGNENNASGLSQRVQAAGWEARLTPIERDGKTLYRVSSGVYSNKDEATEAGRMFTTQFADINFAVRQIEAVSAASENREGLKTWMIQVASFGQEANAISLRDKLRAAGYVAHVSNSRQGQVPYRVRVGPVLRRSEAESTRDRIRSAFDLQGIIVSHP